MTVQPLKRGSVAILGAGTQGRRLAYMWSSQGKDVHLIDAQPKQLEDSVRFINTLRSQRNQAVATLPQVQVHTLDTLSTALHDAWLVVECVPERLELKRQVVAQLDEQTAEKTIIASNSSSYTISEIIRGLKLRDERRILSAHSYWPPETSVIEIMGHATTDPVCISTLLQECRVHGFQPFHVKRDSMGYIYNRVWAAIKREALAVVAGGITTPQEFDAVFKGVLKTPKGPFEQMDVVGLDVVLDIEEHYAQAMREDVENGTPSSSQRAREFLKEITSSGRLGVKNGKGFYEYGTDGEKLEKNGEPAASVAKENGRAANDVSDRMKEGP